MTVRPGASPSAGSESNDRRGLAQTARRILEDHPDADPLRVAALLDVAYGRTGDAKVQNYRLVLAEREVRRRLRSDASGRCDQSTNADTLQPQQGMHP